MKTYTITEQQMSILRTVAITFIMSDEAIIRNKDATKELIMVTLGEVQEQTNPAESPNTTKLFKSIRNELKHIRPPDRPMQRWKEELIKQIDNEIGAKS